MAAPKKKTQLSVYLDPDVMKTLSAYAARREQPMSLIAEAAIAKRFDQQDRRLARLERDVGIGVETLALFIRFWLTTAPPLLEPAANAARAKAGSRYDNFVGALGRWLSQGPRLHHEIPDDVSDPKATEGVSQAGTREDGI